MEERIQAILKERFGRDLDNCTKSEIFDIVVEDMDRQSRGLKG